MLTNKARLLELRQAIEKRKKLIEETGYEHRERDQKHLENQLTMARARFAELQAKQNNAKESPSEVKEEPQQSDHKYKHSRESGNRSKRSSRR